MTQTARVHPLFAESPSELERHPLLRGTPAAPLRAGLETRRLPPGATLLVEAEVPAAVTLILTGSARVVMTADDGRQALTRLALAPGVLGGLESWVGAASPVSAFTMESTRVALFGPERWRRLLAQCPEIHRRWLDMLTEEHRGTFEWHRAALFAGLEERLAQLLLQLVDVYGLPVAAGWRIRVRLRHEDLADLLGAARRSVTRILTEWRAQGWVCHEGGCFIVTQPAALLQKA